MGDASREISTEHLVSVLDGSAGSPWGGGGGRFAYTRADALIDAWSAGEPAFRGRLEAAVAETLRLVALGQRPASALEPALYLADRMGVAGAWRTVQLLVAEIDHSDCSHHQAQAWLHARLLQTLASLQPQGPALVPLWTQQVESVQRNAGSAVCARSALTGLAYLDVGRALRHLPLVAAQVRNEGRRDALRLLLLPLLSARRNVRFLTDIGISCRGLAPDLLGEVREALAAVVEDEELLRAFDRGAGRGERSVELDAPQLPVWITGPPAVSLGSMATARLWRLGLA
jgi:hypothetical protein